jgi:hypothetical protein
MNGEIGMELTPEQAVRNGAEWLDKVYPEWWSRVDLGTLNIDDGETCICGQVFDADDRVCSTGYLFICNISDRVIGPETGFRWREDHGFLVDDEIGNPLWVTEITDRYRAG